jgi:hypothetical protein
MPGGALREVAAYLGIDVDTDKLEKADGLFEGFIEKIKSGGKILAGAFGGFEAFEFVKGQVESAAHLQDLAERLGTTATAIRDFGFAAKASGIDIDSAAHALGTLNRFVGNAAVGGKAADAFTALGVSVKDASGNVRPMQAIVEDVAEALQKLPSQAEKAAAAQSVFGREGRILLPVLAKGKEAIRAMFEESQELSSGLGNAFYKNSKQAREEWEHFDYVMQSFKDQITNAVLPVLTRVGQWMTEAAHALVTLQKHAVVLNTAFTLAAFAGAARLLKTLEELTAFQKLGPVIANVVAKLRALSAAEIVATGGVALLALAIGDLTSNDSKLQSLIDRFVDLVTGTKNAGHEAAGLREAWEALVDIIENVGAIAVSAFVLPLEEAWDVLKGIAKTMADIATFNWKNIGKDLRDTAVELASDFRKRTQQQIGYGRALAEDFTTSAEARARERGTYTPPRESSTPSKTEGKTPSAYDLLVALRTTAPIPGFGHHLGQPIKQDVNVKIGDINVKTENDDPDSVGRAAGRGVRQAGRGIAIEMANTLNSTNSE